MNQYKISFIFLLFFSYSAAAQKYRTAAGVRIGQDDFGITAQQKIRKNTTLEGIAALGGREVSATGLVEQHFPFLGPGFNLYLGAGAHVGHLKDHGGFYGADLLAGAELKVPLMPLVLSLDLKPAFHVNHTEWGDVGGAFSIRYILVKEKKERKKLFGIFGRNDDDDTKSKRRRKKEKEQKIEEERKRRVFDIFKRKLD